MSVQRRFETSLKCLKYANTGRSLTARRTGQVDPELPYRIDPMKGREARESGLRPKAGGCATTERSKVRPDAQDESGRRSAAIRMPTDW